MQRYRNSGMEVVLCLSRSSSLFLSQCRLLVLVLLLRIAVCFQVGMQAERIIQLGIQCCLLVDRVGILRQQLDWFEVYLRVVFSRRRRIRLGIAWRWMKSMSSMRLIRKLWRMRRSKLLCSHLLITMLWYLKKSKRRTISWMISCRRCEIKSKSRSHSLRKSLCKPMKSKEKCSRAEGSTSRKLRKSKMIVKKRIRLLKKLRRMVKRMKKMKKKKDQLRRKQLCFEFDY